MKIKSPMMVGDRVHVVRNGKNEYDGVILPGFTYSYGRDEFRFRVKLIKRLQKKTSVFHHLMEDLGTHFVQVLRIAQLSKVEGRKSMYLIRLRAILCLSGSTMAEESLTQPEQQPVK